MNYRCGNIRAATILGRAIELGMCYSKLALASRKVLYKHLCHRNLLLGCLGE